MCVNSEELSVGLYRVAVEEEGPPAEEAKGSSIVRTGSYVRLAAAAAAGGGAGAFPPSGGQI